MDGVMLSKVREELTEQLKSGYVMKIFQPHNQVLNITFRCQQQNKNLYFFLSPSQQGVFLSNYSLENPLKPPPLTMLLRKYLQGLALKAIEQRGLDRVLTFNFGSYQLMVELMGRHANLALIKDSQVLGVLKPQDENSPRPISPGLPYNPPPLQGKYDPDQVPWSEIQQQIAGEKTWRVIFEFVEGVGPKTARDLSVRAGLDPEKPADQLSTSQFNRIPPAIDWLQNFLQQSPPQPTALFDNGKLFAMFPFQPVAWPQLEQKHYSTLSALLEENIIHSWEREQIQSQKKNLQKIINREFKKKERKLQKLQDDLREARGSENLKVRGELLTAYAHKVEKGQKTVTLPNYYQNNSPIEIQLKPELNPHANAQRYFKKYHKKKKAQKHLKRQIALTRREIKYLEEVGHYLEDASSLQEINELETELRAAGLIRSRRKKGDEKSRSQPRQFKTSDGRDILVGRNNRQNEELFRNSKKHDLWLHAREIPGSHVIIKTENQEVTEKDLLRAAGLAAYFSQGRQDSKVPVDYTSVKNLKKPRGSPPGYVHYENYQTIMAPPQLPSQ